MWPRGPLEGQMLPVWEKSMGTRTIYKREGHWKWDCPPSQRGLRPPKPVMAERTGYWWGLGSSLASKGHLVLSVDKPWITLDVASRKVIFLLDMGIAYSVLTDFPGPLSSPCCIIMGIDGKPKTKLFTPPLNCLLGNFTFPHQFLLMSECPVPLLGRDLLTKLQTIVQAGNLHGENTHQEK